MNELSYVISLHCPQNNPYSMSATFMSLIIAEYKLLDNTIDAVHRLIL